MIMNPAKRRLTEILKDREYREAFVAAYVDESIPFQIRAMRSQKSRRWSQKDLAEKAGMKQARISLLENPNHKNCSIRILKQLAAAFDVALVVRFVPFSELAEWTLHLSSGSLEVPSFNDEEYFKDKAQSGVPRSISSAMADSPYFQDITEEGIASTLASGEGEFVIKDYLEPIRITSGSESFFPVNDDKDRRIAI